MARLTHLIYLLPLVDGVMMMRSPALAPRVQLARTTQLTASQESTVSDLKEALSLVKALRPAEQSPDVQQSLWKAAGLNPTYKVSGARSGEPSFTRLFNHDDWQRYTGKPPLARWMRAVVTWPDSTILRSLWPISTAAALWAFVVTSLPVYLLPRTSPVPMSLFGQALGLLLVFRTQNSYLRLGEARALWSQCVYLCREIAETTSTALLFDEEVGQRPEARAAAARVCRYLAAMAWELNAKLTGPTLKNDVLEALLPDREAAWMAQQRSRPLQLMRSLRRVLHAQFRAGNLPSHLHRKLEEDVKGLDLVVSGCERLFSSPVPPTMSRHIVRCLVLWLIGLPLLLAGSMSRYAVAMWVFVTSYIFVGIEEVGVQVEQPFEIVPMTQLCNVIMANLEEAFEIEPLPKERA